MMQPVAEAAPRGELFGRYVMYGEIAVGGMATVYFGRLRGEGGFSRTVAIKRLHRHFAADPDFVSMLTDEARLAVRVKHPNVVAPFDVVAIDDRELLLVMEYVHGESLAWLLRSSYNSGVHVPLPVTVSLVAGALYGLHAAHEAVSDRGVPLHIVHRDVSPPNILVGVDGVARVLDFGVAKASLRASITRERTTKGKLSYMAPEQLRAAPVDRRTDIFAMGVVLWEMLALRKLFQGDDLGQLTTRILTAPILPPSKYNPEVSAELDAVVARALARTPDERYSTARELAIALERVCPPATSAQVSDWVMTTGGERLKQRADQLAAVERAPLAEVSAPAAPGVSGRRAARTASMEIPIEASTVSSIADDTPPPARAWVAIGRSWRWWAALAAGFVALVLAVLVIALAGSEAPVVTLPAQPLAPAGSPAPAAPEAVELADPRAPTPASAGVKPPSMPTTIAESGARPARAPDRRRTPRAREAPAVARAATPACDPPYVVDGKGIRRIKPECLSDRSSP